MGGLSFGDLTLDSRRVAYIRSLRAVVCADLAQALEVGIAGGVRGVLERVDSVLAEYKPETLIVIGGTPGGMPGTSSALAAMSRRARVQIVVAKAGSQARSLGEAHGLEVHNELVWGKYRFVESDADDQGVKESRFFTLVGRPHYSIRVGRRALAGRFGGMRLPVFLKGLGRLSLPSLQPGHSGASVFKSGLDRHDVFAIGHQRVLPMGKVADLDRALPIAKTTFARRGGKASPDAVWRST